MMTPTAGVRRAHPGAVALTEDEESRPRDDHDSAGGLAGAAPLARVGVFWSAGGVAGPTELFFSSGKHVAAATWTEALARHGQLPHLDIFTAWDQLAASRQQFGGMPEAVAGGAAAPAQFFPETALATRFQRLPYDAVHVPLGLDFTQASYLRARYSHRIFPVTCAQYGISYSFDLHSVFIRLLSASTYPCDAVVCLTQASRWALEQRLGEIAARYSRVWDRPPPLLPRLELIPMGVDTELFAPQDPDRARRSLNLPPDRPILLCVGRLRIEDKMDWSPLLLAFDRVRQRVKSRPLLVLAGANPSDYGEQLLAQAAQLGLHPDVRAFFNLPSACLPSLYAASDVFVSPTDSVSESFGLTIVEAMACGRPVVASDWDGYKELIRHGETGFKVRTDWVDCLGELDELAPLLAWDQQHLHVGQTVSIDIGQLADYLVRLLEDPELRETMGRQGRARVEARYAWPKVIEQWKALWGELAAIARSMAVEAPDTHRTRLDYLRPHYFGHFAHYASRLLDDQTLVHLTPRGKAQLAAPDPSAGGERDLISLLLHPRARGFLHRPSLQATLAVLKPAAWLSASLPLGKLVESLQKRCGLSRDRALMHVMWLAKYDLIAFGAGEPPCGVPLTGEERRGVGARL
jgi:D-inositol-3-phosphate glycosyltransferase